MDQGQWAQDRAKHWEKTIRNYAAEGCAPPAALAQVYRCYYWYLGKLDEMPTS